MGMERSPNGNSERTRLERQLKWYGFDLGRSLSLGKTCRGDRQQDEANTSQTEPDGRPEILFCLLRRNGVPRPDKNRQTRLANNGRSPLARFSAPRAQSKRDLKLDIDGPL